MSTVTIQHPSIGEIVGREGDGVHQFLGVQYATLENRLAESKVKTAYGGGGSVDATRHGYVDVVRLHLHSTLLLRLLLPSIFEGRKPTSKVFLQAKTNQRIH